MPDSPPFGGLPLPLPSSDGWFTVSNHGDDSDQSSDGETEVRYVTPQTPGSQNDPQPPNGGVPPGVSWPVWPSLPAYPVMNAPPPWIFVPRLPPPAPGPSSPALPLALPWWRHGPASVTRSCSSVCHGFCCSCAGRPWPSPRSSSASSSSSSASNGDDDDTDDDDDGGVVRFRLVPPGMHPDRNGGMNNLAIWGFPVRLTEPFDIKKTTPMDVIKVLNVDPKKGVSLVDDQGTGQWKVKKIWRQGKKGAKKSLKKLGIEDRAACYLVLN